MNLALSCWDLINNINEYTRQFKNVKSVKMWRDKSIAVFVKLTTALTAWWDILVIWLNKTMMFQPLSLLDWCLLSFGEVEFVTIVIYIYKLKLEISV